MHQKIEEDSQLLNYAMRELEIMGMLKSTDPMDQQMTKDILDLIKLFSRQNHSGFSAAYCLNCVHKLMRFSPLSPLTGEDEEWIEVTDTLYQNRRYPTVFKDKDGTYDNEGRLVVHANGEQEVVRVPIKFPYMPKKEIVHVDG